MPELPEVETIARALKPLLVGQTISRVEVRWPRSIEMPSADEFERALVGRTVKDASRRGKFVVFSMAPCGALLVHLRMTGQLLLDQPGRPVAPDKHTHVLIHFASGATLRFRDTRKFGRMYLVDDPQQVVGNLGPEPLAEELTPQCFAETLARRHRQIKPLLLDQRILAGVGNIYADEALWEAGIHPLRQAHQLTPQQAHRLWAALRHVLVSAIEHRGTSLRDYRDPEDRPGEHQWSLAMRGAKGQPCRRCGHPIERIVVGQRGTYYCPVCQPADQDGAQPITFVEQDRDVAHSGN